MSWQQKEEEKCWNKLDKEFNSVKLFFFTSKIYEKNF